MKATSIDIVQKQRLRIISTMNYEAEQQEEMHKNKPSRSAKWSGNAQVEIKRSS